MANTKKINTKTLKLSKTIKLPGKIVKISPTVAQKTLKVLSGAESVIKIINNSEKYIQEFEKQLKSHEIKVSNLSQDYEFVKQLIKASKNKKAIKFSKKAERTIKKYKTLIAKFEKQHNVKKNLVTIMKYIEKYI
jgi:hypothetical protein